MSVNYVTKADIRLARSTNLYNYLRDRHPNEVKPVGNSIKWRADHSVSIKRGYSGYYDFGTGIGGNAITFLMDFLNFDFKSAVTELCNYNGCDTGMLPSAPDSHRSSGGIIGSHIMADDAASNPHNSSPTKPLAPPAPASKP